MPSAEPGATIGGYKLVRRIGRGGMAEVWVGSKRLGKGTKFVAIKLLAEHLIGKEMYAKMFRAEAELAGVLTHANIVQVFDTGVDEGRSYLVMEWVDGLNLLKLVDVLALLADDERRWHITSYVIGQLLYALNYAHSIISFEGNPLGIVHRDISPQNVLVSNHGEVKLTDFGVAAQRSEESSGLHVKGKLRYMAPEQLAGKSRKPTVDLYAVGALLHEFLDGGRFRGELDEQDLMSEVLNGEVPQLSRPAPPELEKLRASLLQKNPKDRIQTAEHAIAWLKEYPGHGDARDELAKLCGSLTGIKQPRVGPGPQAPRDRRTLQFRGRQPLAKPKIRRPGVDPAISTTVPRSSPLITGGTEIIRPNELPSSSGDEKSEPARIQDSLSPSIPKNADAETESATLEDSSDSRETVVPIRPSNPPSPPDDDRATPDSHSTPPRTAPGAGIQAPRFSNPPNLQVGVPERLQAPNDSVPPPSASGPRHELKDSVPPPSASGPQHEIHDSVPPGVGAFKNSVPPPSGTIPAHVEAQSSYPIQQSIPSEPSYRPTHEATPVGVDTELDVYGRRYPREGTDTSRDIPRQSAPLLDKRLVIVLVVAGVLVVGMAVTIAVVVMQVQIDRTIAQKEPAPPALQPSPVPTDETSQSRPEPSSGVVEPPPSDPIKSAETAVAPVPSTPTEEWDLVHEAGSETGGEEDDDDTTGGAEPAEGDNAATGSDVGDGNGDAGTTGSASVVEKPKKPQLPQCEGGSESAPVEIQFKPASYAEAQIRFKRVGCKGKSRIVTLPSQGARHKVGLQPVKYKMSWRPKGEKRWRSSGTVEFPMGRRTYIRLFTDSGPSTG